MNQQRPQYADYPIEMLTPIPEKSYAGRTDEIIIPPLGKALAVVKGDGDPQPRSRWARVGLQILPDRRSSGVGEDGLRIVLINWSSSHGLIIRRGELITLADIEHIRKMPLAEKIPLYAGHTFLAVRERALRPAILGGKRFSVLDSDKVDLYTCTRCVPYDELILARGESAVLPVQEISPAPENCIGVFESARPYLIQNASRLEKPGSNGVRVMEVKTLHHIRIRPGQQIGWLSRYESPVPLPEYSGRFK